MNKKLLAFMAVPALGLSLLGMSAASAHGLGFGGMGFLGANFSADDFVTRHNTMFQSQAALLGLSVDEVKAAWASGKTMQALAKEKGISATDIQKRLADARATQMTAQFKALVDKGVITQAQADQRLAFIKTQASNNPKSKKMGRGLRGMGLGF